MECICNEIWLHLEDLDNSVNQYFPNGQCIRKLWMDKRYMQYATVVNVTDAESLCGFRFYIAANL